MPNFTYTIGMAVYDDNVRSAFTTMAALIYHRQCGEVLVVDNNPKSKSGEQLRLFCASTNGKARYIAFPDPQGTAAPRNAVFDNARFDYVVCIDSHVLLYPSALLALTQYYQGNGELCGDLLQGPMVYENGSADTHMNDEWRGEMWGTWGQAWIAPNGKLFTCQEVGQKVGYRAVGPDSNGTQLWLTPADVKLPMFDWAGHQSRLVEAGCKQPTQPFEIMGHGMGAFACRKDSWLRFNDSFRGFGGEEMYIQAKFRKAGKKAMCVPGFGWWHHFHRDVIPYRLTVWDKVRNYIVGAQELGLPLHPIYEHFVASGKMPKHEWDAAVNGEMMPRLGAVVPVKSSPCATTGQTAEQVRLAGLERLYSDALSTPSDMSPHGVKLRELAEQCETVVEFGVNQSASTRFLLAAKPKKLISYDANVSAQSTILAHFVMGTDYESRTGRPHNLDAIPDCDLLLISGVNMANDLWEALIKHASKVNKWIAISETTAFGLVGPDKTPGLLAALREFMKRYPEWTVSHHSPAGRGLTIISKMTSDKGELPSTLTMAWNYTKAMAKHAASGAAMADEKTVTLRLDTCAMCSLRRDNRCTSCGCYLDEGPGGVAGKAALATSECPLGFWAASEREGRPVIPLPMAAKK